MAGKEDGRQVRSVDIGRGLYLVRYGSAKDPFGPPRVTVSVAPEEMGNVEFVLAPDAREPILWQPDAALVVRVSTQARLLIEAMPLRPGGSNVANVKVERLVQGEPSATNSLKASAIGSLDVSRLRLIGHVAGLGDVAVGPNEWIAGPAAPSRIEGIAVEWPGKPAQLNLHYSVRVAKPQANATPMLELGSFAGTRRQALPLTGLVFELSGPASPDVQLFVESSFLGSPILRATGKRVVLSGPTGREPLVGLRLNVEAISAPGSVTPAPARPLEPVAATAPPVPATKTKQAASGRVRVFRSRSKDDQRSE